MLSHSNRNILLYTFVNKQTLVYISISAVVKVHCMKIYLVRLIKHKKVGHSFTTKISLKLGFLTICSGIINLCI